MGCARSRARADPAASSVPRASSGSAAWPVARVEPSSDEWAMIVRFFEVGDPGSLGIGRDVCNKVGDPGARRQLYNGLRPLLAWKIRSPRRRTIYNAEKEHMVDDRCDLKAVCEMQPVSTKLDAAAQMMKLDARVNEHILLHGTKPCNVHAILRNGLNERVSSGHFGHAVYFSEDASKSDQYCTPDDGRCDSQLCDGLYADCGIEHPGCVCYAIVCRVALGFPVYTKNGRHALGKAGMSLYSSSEKRELAAIPGSHPPIAYHSLVVQAGPKSEGFAVTRHREFLIFNSNHIVEEYIVAYQRTLDGNPVAFQHNLSSTSLGTPPPMGSTSSNLGSMSSNPGTPPDGASIPMALSRTGSSRSLTKLHSMENLIRDMPQKGSATAVVKNEVLRISGVAEFNCFNGKRSDAPILWVGAPKPSTPSTSLDADRFARPCCNWTAWVKCRFTEASDSAAALFTVYDGPDGTGHIGFCFGPRTLGGRGICYQPTNVEECKPSGDDPCIWHELRMRRYDGEEGDSTSLFDLAYRPCDERYAADTEEEDSDPDDAEWISVAEAVKPFRNVVGKRIALGLRQAQKARCQVEFKCLRIYRDRP